MPRTVFLIALILASGTPLLSSAYSNYGTHTFAPYTYVNTMPVVYVDATSYASAYSSAYNSYPSYYTAPVGYSYPTGRSYPRQHQGYASAPSYASQYRSENGEYCYSGYGCYPLEVKDPHQWVYDKWTGTWY